MQDLLSVTGMVLKVEPIGEYDRRVVILTKEKGKISCFAKGARKQGSRLMASTNPFCFGEFKLYVGKNSYSLNEAVISNYFENLRMDLEGALYGMYFLEVIDYFTRENNDERQMLKLLYQSLRALSKDVFEDRFVRYVFEIKAISINGEYPGVPKDMDYDESTVYTVEFIYNISVEKLFTFRVSDNVLIELEHIASVYMNQFTDKNFKSMELL